MRTRLLLFFAILLMYSSWCTSGNLDSVRKAVSDLPDDTATVVKLIRLSEVWGRSDESIAEFLASKAYTLATKLGVGKVLFWARINLGNKLLGRGNYTEAGIHLQESLRLAEELNDPEAVAKACVSLGNFYGYQDQGDAALPYYDRALKYFKSVHNLSRMETVINNIGNIYYGKTIYDRSFLQKAEGYFMEAHDMLRDLKDTVKLIANENNLGLVFSDEGKCRESLRFLNNCEALCKAQGDTYDLIFTTSYIGRAYNELGKYDSAIIYLKKSLELSQNMNNVPMTADAFINLSQSFSQKKNFESAFEYMRQYQSLHDSLINSDNTRKMADAQSKYENEKKARQIELLEINGKHQHRIYTYITWSLIAGSVLLLLLAVQMYNRYSLKNKSHQQLSLQNTIIAQKNKDITDSINYAKKIQEAMLPSIASIRKALPASFVFYEPKDIVSGDFYWFTEKKGKIFLAAVDCTGHGVPGAFMSMIGNDMLFDAVADKELSNPGEVLASLNLHVKNSLKQHEGESGSRDGMDICLCVFEKDYSSLQYSGANRPFYLQREGEVQIIAPTKASIGGLTDSEQIFETVRVPLQKGDTLYIFTDGFCDQFGGPDGKKFTTKRLRELLQSLKDKPLETIEQQLKQAFGSWKTANEQVDDVLLIGIRI
jgi:serine phosphatase RsbU (regulator of sigma subunit)